MAQLSHYGGSGHCRAGWHNRPRMADLPLAPNRLVFFLLVAFLVTAMAARALAHFAERIGLIDQPGGRKQHLAPVPVTGGIAMFMGFAAAALASGLVFGHTVALISALGLLLIGGVADDMRDITARAKFWLQLAAALLMTSWAGVFVDQLGNLLGFHQINIYHWAIPFSVVCALGVINAVNMVDGLDGAAGGISFVAALWLAFSAALQGLGAQAALLLILAAAILGFLVWNLRLPGRRHAAVFMGDAGSMMLGLSLCWFAIDLTQGERRSMPPIVCVWILAVPLLDMARVMFVRLLRRASVLDADREHLHYYLLARGWSVSATAWAMIGVAALTGAVGVGAWRLGVPEWVLFYLFAAIAIAILAAASARELRMRGENDLER
jgi:UDP-GlcNAc:undecaprenyl-phosphate GlcNAc-1-phosphate transferase